MLWHSPPTPDGERNPGAQIHNCSTSPHTWLTLSLQLSQGWTTRGGETDGISVQVLPSPVKPSSHAHVKLPSVLVQMPCSESQLSNGSPFELVATHSFKSTQLKGPRPSLSNSAPGLKPLRQPHAYLVGRITSSGARSSQ